MLRNRLDDSLTNYDLTLSQLDKNPEQKAVQALYTILEYFDAGSVENIKVRIGDAGGSILHVALVSALSKGYHVCAVTC